MNKTKKMISVIIAASIILSFVVLYLLYSNGLIAKQDVQITNKGVHVSVGLRPGKDYPFHYATGFFITKNKVVTVPMKNFDNFDFKILDVEENEYNVIDIKSYKNITVMTTDRDNMSNIKYFYGFPKKNDTVKAFIKDTKYVKYLSDCKVTDTNYQYNGIKFSICDEKIEGEHGGAVIDKYGRILGMTLSPGEEHKMFFIYPQSEIMKDIIVDEIKDFFGIK